MVFGTAVTYDRDLEKAAHLLVVALVGTDLRAEVVGGPNLGGGQLEGGAEHLAHTKVTQFQQAARGHKNVLTLEVSAVPGRMRNG